MTLSKSFFMRGGRHIKIGPIGRELSALAALSIPLILTHWAWIAIGITDLFMIAWLSPEALAAGGLAQMHQAFFVFAFNGVLSGALPIMSQDIGAKRYEAAAVTFRQSILLAGVLSVVAYIGIWPADLTIMMAGQTAELAAHGAEYIRIVALILPATLTMTLMRHFAAAYSRPRLGLFAIGVGLVVNVVLNYGLMFGELGMPRLELIGAAWSSVISLWLVCAIMVAVLATDSRIRIYFPFRGSWRLDRARFGEILRVGIPIGFTNLSEVGIFIASAFVIGQFGVAQVGGNSIAGEVAGIAFAIPVGMQQATIVRVGWAVGAGAADAVRRIAWTSTAFAVAIGIISAVIIWFSREEFVHAIMKPAEITDPAVIEAAIGVIAVVAIYQLVDVPQACVNGALRGMKDTRWPLLVFIPSYWIFGAGLALILAFGLNLKAPGIWAGLSSGIALTLLVLSLRLRWQLTKLQPTRIPFKEDNQ